MHTYGTATDYPVNDGGDLSLPTERERQYAMLLHLSSLASYLAPLAGIVVPIALWLARKDESPGIDRHGREVLNFTISYLIYTAISIVLCFVLIGVPMLFLLGIIVVVSPVVAAVKASDGQYWHYPLTMRFF